MELSEGSAVGSGDGGDEDQHPLLSVHMAVPLSGPPSQDGAPSRLR